MCVEEVPEADAALAEIRECCNAIAAALDKAIRETNALGDDEMLRRLKSARSATNRACELVDHIAEFVTNEAPAQARKSKAVNSPV